MLKRFGIATLAAVTMAGSVAMTSTADARGGGGFRGGGFHGGGFHGGGFHGGRSVVIAPRIGFGGYGRGWYGPRWGWGAPYYRSGYSQFVFANSAAAESQGYHDGMKTGASDAKKGKSDDPERSHYYQNAGFGNFADDYRQGFMDGYDAGFRS